MWRHPFARPYIQIPERRRAELETHVRTKQDGATLGELPLNPREGAARGCTLTRVRSLEDYLPCKLYKAWVVHLTLTGNHAEVGGPSRVGRRNKLHTVEGVEQLGPKFEPELLIGTEGRVLKYGKIPVVDAGSLQAVNTRLVSPGIRCRGGEACWVDPTGIASQTA